MAQRGRPVTFKQHELTSTAIRHGHVFLQQNDRLFTNAEFNKVTRFWDPVPRLVSDEELENIAAKVYAEEIQRLNDEVIKNAKRLCELDGFTGGRAFTSRDALLEVVGNGQDKGADNSTA